MLDTSIRENSEPMILRPPLISPVIVVMATQQWYVRWVAIRFKSFVSFLQQLGTFSDDPTASECRRVARRFELFSCIA